MHRTDGNLKIVICPSRTSHIFGPQKKSGLSTSNTLLLTTLATGVCLCSPAAISAIHREVFVMPGKLTGDDVRAGKTSWFGQYGYGKYRDGMNNHVWRDRGDNGQTASGMPQTTPGIALPTRKHLKHWFEVELKGKKYTVQQTDVGPAKWTGRKIDINAPLADMAGWTPKNFPTDSVVKYRYLGPPGKMPQQDLPANVAGVTAPKLALLEKQKQSVDLAEKAVTAGMGKQHIDDMNLGLPPPVPKVKTLKDIPAKIVGKIPYGMHPVILKSMTEASKLLPDGWNVRFDNAKRNHSSVGSRSYHIKEDQYGALAVDIQLINNGKKLPMLQSPKHFAVYRDFMHYTKKLQYELFPDYRGRGRWGGYFTSGVSQDLMHYDLGPERGTQAGNWEKGLKSGYRHFGLSGDVGKGMGTLAGFSLPMPIPPEMRTASIDFVREGRMGGRRHSRR